MKKGLIGLGLFLIAFLIGYGASKNFFGEYNNVVGGFAFLLFIWGVILIAIRVKKWAEN